MSALKRFWPLLALAALAALLLASGLWRELSLEGLARHRATLAGFVEAHRALAVAAFVLAYALVTAASIPGALFMTLAGGLLFGVWVGGAATVVGATLGALAAFYAVRSSLGAALRARAERSGGVLKSVMDGFGRDAFAYVLTLRLIPAAPFWLVNAAAGLAHAPVRPYALATLLGIIPGTFIYAGIGAGLGDVLARGERPDLGVIFEPQILLPLVALGLLSLASALFRRRRRGAA